MARTIATNTTVNLNELRDFIRSRHPMVLLTRRSDGTPPASPVTGGVDDEGRIVISTYPERAKTANARRRPRSRVLVLSDDFGDAWVQVDGICEVLDVPNSVEPLVEYSRKHRWRTLGPGRVPTRHARTRKVDAADHPDPKGTHRHRRVPGSTRRPGATSGRKLRRTRDDSQGAVA